MDSRIKVTKCFSQYTSEQRANMRSSHRLGYQQRQSVGEAFWINGIDNIAYTTRKAAIAAAERYYASIAPKVICEAA